jgi:hypothetical protein
MVYLRVFDAWSGPFASRAVLRPVGGEDAPARSYAVAQFQYGTNKDFTDREKYAKNEVYSRGPFYTFAVNTNPSWRARRRRKS